MYPELIEHWARCVVKSRTLNNPIQRVTVCAIEQTLRDCADAIMFGARGISINDGHFFQNPAWYWQRLGGFSAQQWE